MRSDLTDRLRAALGSGATPVPGLVGLHLRHDTVSAALGRNHGVPAPGMTADPGDGAALIAAMAVRARLPRVELLLPDPTLEVALTTAGFAPDGVGRLPVLVLGSLAAAAPPRGGTVALATDRDDLRAAAVVQDEAYAGGEEASAAAGRLAHLVAAGGLVALAHGPGGEPVSAGLATPPDRRLCEIAAVATDLRWRRQGYAAAVASLLAEHVLRGGATPFLQAMPAEVALYERLGFHHTADLVAMVAPAPAGVVPAWVANGEVVLEPVNRALAERVLAGDTRGVEAARGWPSEDSVAGFRLGLGTPLGALGWPDAGWLVLVDGVVVGDCGVHGPPSPDGVVELGYGLVAGARGRGLGRAAIDALTGWLLAQPAVRRVTARVEPGNEASLRALRAAGFTETGHDADMVLMARS